MKKLAMHSKDLTQENLAKIQAAFPNCITESKDENGNVKLSVDFDLLRQELADHIVEGPQERYRLDWPGKREAMLAANAPIAKTLRPAREESVDFDNTENLFIEGDNLEALKLLQENYLGKVKMIYIDPPYNTGKDFVYNDDFAESAEEYFERSNQVDEEGNRLVANTDSNGRFHSDWLSMMLPRLKLARNLLRDDGAIFIHIDENELSNLLKICNEVLGSNNFINLITIKTKVAGVSGSSVGRSLQGATEYIVLYAKNKNSIFFNTIYETTSLYEHIKNYRHSGKSWKYTTMMISKGEKKLIKYSPDKKMAFYGYQSVETKSVTSFAKENNMLEEDVYNKYANQIFRTTNAQSSVRTTVIEETKGSDYPLYSCIYKPIKGKNQNLETEVFYLPGTDASQRNMVMFLSDVVEKVNDEYFYLNKKGDLWDDIDYNNLSSEGRITFPNGKKPIKLIQRMLQMVKYDDEEQIIVDFFAGSSTTAHATMQLNAEDGGNRKFIMVQLPEEVDEKHEAFKAGYKTIAEISKERIRRAGKQILEGECHEDWNKDVGFRVLKVDTSNMKDVYYRPQDIEQKDMFKLVDNIKEDRSSEDLLFQVLLESAAELNAPIRRETIQGKEVFFVNDNDLIACFDNNITEALINELATHQPLRVVFRDSGFADNSVKTNVTQIFKQLSEGTEVRSI